MKSPRSKAYLALTLVCFFWGTTWVAARQGVQYMPAMQLASIRQILGGLCYILFFLFKGARFPRGKQWWPVIILSILNFIMANALSTWGVKYISAGLGSIIGAIFPLWLVIVGLVVKKTIPKGQSLAGLLIGFAGICVIFYEHLEDFLLQDFQFGIFISVVSTWSWAFGMLYTKKQAAHFNPYFNLGLQMLLSGVVVFTGTQLTHTAVPLHTIPWQAWAAIAYLITFGSILAFTAYIYTLQHLTTEQASLYAYINPIVAVLLGAWLFNEPLTAFIIAGVCIALYGVYLVNRSEKEPINSK